MSFASSLARPLYEVRRRGDSDLQRAFVLRFVDSLATTTMAFVVPLMVYGITHNIAWSGASFMLEWLPRLSAIPVAGPIVDRIGATRFFLFADSLRGLIVAAAAVWLWHDPRAWTVVVLTAVLTGMLAQSTFVAAEKLGVEVTGSKPLHHVQAVQVGIDQVVQVLGPVVGGALLAVAGGAALVAVAGLLALSVYLAWRLDCVLVKPDASEVHQQRMLAGFRAGLRVIGEHRSLVHIIFGAAAFNLLLALLLTITPAVVEQRFHRGTASVSMVWTMAAAASVLSVGIASRAAKRYGVSAIGFASAVVGCAACVTAGLTHAYWAYVVCLMAFLAADASYAVFIRTVRARLIPRAVYGTTVSVIVMLILAPYPIAGALVAVVPFARLGDLVVVCSAFTALLTCWSFAAMDHTSLNASEPAHLAEAAQPAA